MGYFTDLLDASGNTFIAGPAITIADLSAFDIVFALVTFEMVALDRTLSAHLEGGMWVVQLHTSRVLVILLFADYDVTPPKGKQRGRSSISRGVSRIMCQKIAWTSILPSLLTLNEC